MKDIEACLITNSLLNVSTFGILFEMNVSKVILYLKRSCKRSVKILSSSFIQFPS